MISVIVPVYNVEQYLQRCVQSIINQSYRDFELLLIDDGSTDNSGSICDEFGEKDSRILVFHKENGGLSDARNYGLDSMRGEYVSFIDSDDYIGPNYLQILIDMIDGADVSAVSIKNTYSTGYDIIESDDKRMSFKGMAILKEIMRGKDVTCSACAKLYRRELFQDRRFPKGKLYEDLLTIPYMFVDKSVCNYSTSKQYYYFRREGSIINSVSNISIETWLIGMNRLTEYTMRKCPKHIKWAQSMFVKGVFWKIIDWKLYSPEYVELSQMIRKKNKDAFVRSLILPGLTAKEKIKGLVFFINVKIYRIIRISWIKAIDNPDSRCYIHD